MFRKQTREQEALIICHEGIPCVLDFLFCFVSSLGPENNEPVLITQHLNLGPFFPLCRQHGADNRKAEFSFVLAFLLKSLLPLKFKRMQVSPPPSFTQTPFYNRFHVQFVVCHRQSKFSRKVHFYLSSNSKPFNFNL